MSLNQYCRVSQWCPSLSLSYFHSSPLRLTSGTKAFNAKYPNAKQITRFSYRTFTNSGIKRFSWNEFSCVQNAAGHAAKMQCRERSFLQLARLQYIAPHRRSSSSEPAKSSSINAEEVEKFSRIAHHWWNESGEFTALHTLNELRVTMIRDGLVERDTARSSLPLKGLKILDVGCGGGILSEPLARLGADVMGLDASQENIAVATQHAANDPALAGRLRYVCSAVEDLKSNDTTQYDAVILSEIIEHVNDLRSFLESCCTHVKSGGSVFVTTINQTTLSYALAVVAAERIFRIVPPGTHDWNKFVTPQRLQQILSQNSFSTRLIHGLSLNPLSNKWSWTRDTSVNYALHAIKIDNTRASKKI